ncbi:efflux RND transporter permease subunit [Pedobacter sp. L105]|uniref:efflux RND transporter permease subunit n=1 Tax=Pedobacter sp. L105 TaxID=1641871 RepID=UPI00131C50AA|nr:efflux RND transporter permease subunit [Pedobacter sp. L105]
MSSPFRIVIIFIAIALSCLLFLPDLNINLLPEDTGNELVVSFALPGATPDIIELQVTSLLENVFSQLRDLKEIKSVSSYSLGQIQLHFDRNADMEMKRFEILSLIRQVKSQLPEQISYPTVSQAIDEQAAKIKSPTLIYTVNAREASYKVKYNTQELIKKSLSAVPGVGEVEVTGASGLQVTIKYNQEKLKSYQLEPSQLLKLIGEQTRTSYPGSITTSNHQELFIKVNSNQLDIKSLQDLAISKHDPALRLKDVADVYFEEEEPNQFFRINGKNSVNVSIYPKVGINIIKFVKDVKEQLKNIEAKLPQGYELRLSYDDTEFLHKELTKNYSRTVIALLILLLFVLLSYRNWRYLLNLFLSLTMNFCLTLLMVGYLHIPIHIYSLAGLSIAFGIMIDHAIIMVDYYSQYRNRKVFLALLGATLTTITALLLIFFLPEEQKKDLKDFAVIIIIALTTSLLTNLWFTVGLHRIFFQTEPIRRGNYIKKISRIKFLRFKKYSHLIGFLARYRKAFVIIIVFLFGLPLFMLPDKINHSELYKRTLGSALYQEKIRPITDRLLGGTLYLFKSTIYENSRPSEIGRTKLFVNAELPIGNTIFQMNTIFENLENYLSGIKGIDTYVTNVYSGQQGSMVITFDEQAEKSNFPFELKSLLTDRALEWGGVKWNIFGFGRGFSNEDLNEVPTFKIIVRGYNYDELQRITNQLAQELSINKRIQNININASLADNTKVGMEYRLNLNNDRLGFFKTNPQELLSALVGYAKPGSAAAHILINNELYPLMIKEKNSDEYSQYQMLNGNTEISSDNQVKIKDMGSVSLQKSATRIYKEDRQYIKVIGLEYMGSYELGTHFLLEKLNLINKKIPIGYLARIQRDHSRDQSKDVQFFLVLILLVLNYVIIAILFENLRQPLYIICTIPISFIGLFMAFYLFDFPFDQGGYTSFIMLGGLIVNAGIFIVNDLNQAKPFYKSYNKTLIKVVINRGRTIFLTTAATICGLIPFLIDGPNEPFWFSLAIGTIGGLIFSFFAIFIALPVFLYQKTK